MFRRKSVDVFPSSIVGKDFKEFRVAIVDDNPVVQKIMTKSLKKFFHVNVTDDDVFANGLGLLKALEFRRYDLILMDIEMPVMTGWAATKLIRGDRRSASMKNLMSELKTLTVVPAYTPSSTDGSLARRTRAASISRPSSRGPLASPLPSSPTEPDQSFEATGARILGENRLVPIVAVTSAVTPELREAYLDAGMNEVLVKPVTPAVVQEILGKYLQAVQLSPTRGLAGGGGGGIGGGNGTISRKTGAALKDAGKNGGNVEAGTKEELLDALLHPARVPEDGYVHTFLLTYRSFLEPDALLKWLRQKILRFGEPVKSNDDVSQKTTQAGLMVLQTWITEQWHDFATDAGLKVGLIDLIGLIRGNESEVAAEPLKLAMEKQTARYKIHAAQIRDLLDPSNQQPRTISESLLTPDVLPDNLAQQMCLYDSMLFRMIDGIDFIQMGWKQTSPQLAFFIERFDKESYWVASEILGKKDLKARSAVLRTFIVTAKECLEAQNYFSTFAIMFGLSLAPVRRLKNTWESLSDNKKKVLAELEKFTDVSKNFKTYRDRLDVAAPPLLPFLPIFLKDLTFINDGNDSRLPDGRINFDKLRLLTDCVRGITAFARSEYKWWNFDPDMQEYITNPPLEMNISTLQAMSLAVEPRVAA
ncbi:hypothetical protein HKX48_001148 [Thoreauomyces humboldtii]|nr:hypothetical protein HKX48_001148 [Thoreauomyces humboldtii]